MVLENFEKSLNFKAESLLCCLISGQKPLMCLEHLGSKISTCKLVFFINLLSLKTVGEIEMSLNFKAKSLLSCLILDEKPYNYFRALRE